MSFAKICEMNDIIQNVIIWCAAVSGGTGVSKLPGRSNYESCNWDLIRFAQSIFFLLEFDKIKVLNENKTKTWAWAPTTNINTKILNNSTYKWSVAWESCTNATTAQTRIESCSEFNVKRSWKQFLNW